MNSLKGTETILLSTNTIPFFGALYLIYSGCPAGELIVYQSIRRLSVCLAVCVSVCVSVNIFKLEYLRNQLANRNEILSEPSLGWGKDCIRFWARSDRNSGVHGNG